MYNNTNLTKEQYIFLVNWCNGLERIKRTRQSENLKLLVEHFFFYVSGKDMHVVMSESGIKGDRWNHNVSSKHLKKISKIKPNHGLYNSIEEKISVLDYRNFL